MLGRISRARLAGDLIAHSKLDTDGLSRSFEERDGRGGRVVYRGGLENRWAARSRGFESLPLRHLGHLTKILPAVFATKQAQHLGRTDLFLDPTHAIIRCGIRLAERRKRIVNFVRSFQL